LAALVLGGLVGQAARDRTAALGLMMYLLFPAGLSALAFDLACLGRALPWPRTSGQPRFALAALGAAGALVAAWPMVGAGTGTGPSGDEVVLLHWNVQWGGGPWVSPATWAAQRAAIVRRGPDVVVLSEAPNALWLAALAADLDPGTRRGNINNGFTGG
jgi:hypothetical protein